MKDVWFPYAWDDVPLDVKTISAIGSLDEIHFDVATSNWNSALFARVVVRMENLPIYYVDKCQQDTPLSNFPDHAANNQRIWSFIKNGFEGLSIKCNDVLVAEFLFTESKNPECLTSGWTTKKINYLRFNPDWDRTVGIRIRGM